ncbi:hypothetical protein BDW74DRAFT_172592 [Aspergillus multicolor]|uniref:uncharacterized protein n=1 Tax=Aspergillus multicolor TaxID=41759 RepID=UPI003CCD0525
MSNAANTNTTTNMTTVPTNTPLSQRWMWGRPLTESRHISTSAISWLSVEGDVAAWLQEGSICWRRLDHQGKSNAAPHGIHVTFTDRKVPTEDIVLAKVLADDLCVYMVERTATTEANADTKPELFREYVLSLTTGGEMWLRDVEVIPFAIAYNKIYRCTAASGSESESPRVHVVVHDAKTGARLPDLAFADYDYRVYQGPCTVRGRDALFLSNIIEDNHTQQEHTFVNAETGEILQTLSVISHACPGWNRSYSFSDLPEQKGTSFAEIVHNRNVPGLPPDRIHESFVIDSFRSWLAFVHTNTGRVVTCFLEERGWPRPCFMLAADGTPAGGEGLEGLEGLEEGGELVEMDFCIGSDNYIYPGVEDFSIGGTDQAVLEGIRIQRDALIVASRCVGDGDGKSLVHFFDY